MHSHLSPQVNAPRLADLEPVAAAIIRAAMTAERATRALAIAAILAAKTHGTTATRGDSL